MLPLQVVRISVPYVFAALGGVVSERSGVMNIALEGTLLGGAFGAILGTHATGSAAFGLLCGLGAGVALQLLLALFSVRFGAHAIVCGLAVNLFALAATRLLLKITFDSSAHSPRVETGAAGLVLQACAPLVVVVVYGLLYRTRFGLRLRASGESPEAVVDAGLSLGRIRWAALAVAGLLGGAGGAALAFDQHGFVDAMSAGRGYVALAAVVFSGWRPVRAALACLAFGLAETAQIELQTSGLGLPTQLVQLLPYVVTLVALAAGASRTRAPAGLGAP